MNHREMKKHRDRERERTKKRGQEVNQSDKEEDVGEKDCKA